MTGVLLITVVFFWLFLSLYIAGVVYKRFRWAKTRRYAGVLLFVFLFTLPVWDELIGGWQFRSLCSSDSKIDIDEKSIRDKKLMYVGAHHLFVEYYTALPITVYSSKFNDVETGKAMVSYRSYHLGGGWLIRFLGISEGNSPLLSSAGCAPENEDSFKEKYNVRVLN